MEKLYPLNDTTKQYLQDNGMTYEELLESKYAKQDIDRLHNRVQCDTFCQALEQPATYQGAMATLEHYRDHSYLSGCSHGN